MAISTKWTSELLGDFCSSADFKLGFVPADELLVPPQQNSFVDHHDLVDQPQPDSVDGAFASVPDDPEVTAALHRFFARRFDAAAYITLSSLPRDRRRLGAAEALTAPSYAPTSSGCSTSRIERAGNSSSLVVHRRSD